MNITKGGISEYVTMLTMKPCTDWKDSPSNINNSVISRSFCLAASIDVAQAQNVCQRCWLAHRTYTHMNMMTDKQINRDENITSRSNKKRSFRNKKRK